MGAKCLDCVRKHLEQAMVIHEEEVPLGYPEHVRRVRGHLAEGSREALPTHGALAALLRAWRLALQEGSTELPEYDEILDYVEAAIAAENSYLPIPAVPADLFPTNNVPEEMG